MKITKRRLVLHVCGWLGNPEWLLDYLYPDDMEVRITGEPTKGKP